MNEHNRTTTRSRPMFILLTVVIATILLLVLLELFVRIYGSGGGIYDLEQWKYGKYMKRKSENQRIGFEHVPGKKMRLQGHMVSINRFGFRDEDYPVQRPPNTVRIVVLGDSMTFGWGSEFDAVFSKVLERRLKGTYKGNPNVELINMGCGNYNTSMEVESFKEKGLPLSPQIALLNYFINDAEVTPKRSKDPLLDTPFQLPAVIWSRVHKLFAAVNHEKDYKQYYEDLYKPNQVGWLRTQEALKEFFSLCRARGIVPLVSIIPELHDVSDQYPFGKIHEKVRKICDSSGVTCIDLLPAFAGKVGSDFWASGGDPHLNARGHALIAGALFPELVKVIDAVAEKEGKVSSRNTGTEGGP